MSTAYTFYESQGSRKGLDTNKVALKDASEYPRALYKAQPFNPTKTQPMQYIAMTGPKDKEIDYILFKDRNTHPDHFARFGYPWCPNGYCTANHPGRYNTPPGMMWQTNAQPQGMAPQRFYEGQLIDPNYVSSPAYNDAFETRQSY